MTIILKRPVPQSLSDYYKTYIDQVDGDDFLGVLRMSVVSTTSFLLSVPKDKWDYAYADGKWSLKEVLIHMIDTERIFAYRALRFARNDMEPLPGFDQDSYIPFCNASNRSTDSIIEEYQAVRSATIHLFENMDDEALDRQGTASGSPFSARAVGFVIAGHELHHLQVIREKYM